MSILFNGTSDYAWARFATPMLNTANAFSAYVMFRTPATFANSTIWATTSSTTGAIGSRFGYSLDFRATGRIRAVSYTSGGIITTAEHGGLLPNTTYRALIVKTAGSPNISLYLNSLTYMVAGTGMAESGANLQGMVIGKDSNTNGAYFAGQVEDVAIWRSVLSNADINTLFETKRRPTDLTVQPDDYWPLVTDDDAPTAGTYDLVRTGPAIASSTLITAAASAPTTKVLGTSDVSGFTANTLIGGSGEYVLPAFTAAADATIFRLGLDVNSFYSTNAFRLSLRDSGGNLLTTGIIGNASTGSLTVEVPVVNITAGQVYYITICYQGGLQLRGNAYSGGYIVYKNTTSSYDTPLAQFTIADRMTYSNFAIPHVWAEGSSGTSDTTSDVLVFTPATGAEKNTLTTSNNATVAGVTDGIDLPISIVNGEFSINGGTWRTASYITKLGDGVRVRRNSSTAYTTPVTTTVTINGVDSTFTITTRAADTIPNPYTFTGTADVQPSTLSISNTITVLGIDPDVTTPISVTNGEYSINGGAYTALAGTVALNNTVTVRGTSNAALSGTSTVTLDIGTVPATFVITTTASGGPAINVVSSNIIVDEVTGYTVTTYNLPTASGATIDGRAVPNFIGTANSYGFNAFTLSNGSTHPRYGAGRVLSVNGSANTTVTVSPKATQGYVTLSAVNASAPFIGSYVTTAIGDQIVFDLPATLGTTTNTVDATGRIVSSYGSVQNFWHISASTGLVTLIAITAPDSIPTPIVFAPQTEIVPSTVTESNSVTIAGATVNQPLDVSIVGGEYAVNTGSGFGAWTAIAGTIKNGDIVKVRRAASASFSTAVQTTLTVNGANSIFSITTIIPDVVADTPTFVPATDAEINNVIESNTITVSGITANFDVPIAVAGGEYAINTGSSFGPWTTLAGTVRAGHQVKVRGSSSPYYSLTRTTNLSIGSVSASFLITTRTETSVSVTGGAVNVNGVVNTLSVVNLANADTLQLGSYNVTTLSGSGTTYQFTIPALADGILYPKYGTQLLTIAKNSIFGTVFVDIYPQATKGYVTLTSVNNSAGYIGSYLSCAIGDQLIFDLPSTLSVTSNSVGLDGRINTDYRGTQVIYHRRNSDGLITQINLNTQILIDLTSLIKNATKPYIDGHYPLGNR